MITDNYDINLFKGPQTRGQKFIEDLNRIREHDPVYWSDLSHCWIVSRFQDVTDGFHLKYPLMNGGKNEFSLASIPLEERDVRIPTLKKYVNCWIVGVDAPEHTRLRKLMMQAFTKKMVEKLKPYVRERVNQLLDQAVATPEIEFNEEIARPLPGSVIFKLAGIPEEYFPSLKEWSIAIVEGMVTAMPPPEALERTEWAMTEIDKVVLAELEKRKQQPRDDLLTAFLHASEDGGSLSRDELLSSMQVVVVAGHDTTSNTMTLGLEALSRHPEAWQYMYENPDKILQCVNELMRYVAMTGGQPRNVGEDFEWHGKQLKKGDIVFLSVIGANRDPRAFKNPEKLDFTRDTTESQVFGPGVHHCIGHLLAKMQLCEFFATLVERFESVDVLDEELKFMPVSIFRGLYELNVRFHPRAS